MFPKKAHSILAIVLIGLFLTAKLAVYHSFSHENECVECCKVCDLVAAHADTPFLLDHEAIDNKEQCLPVAEHVNTNFYQSRHYATPLNAHLFCRPPPAQT